MALTPAQLAELQRLRQMFVPLAEQAKRDSQRQDNMDKMNPQNKAGGGMASAYEAFDKSEPSLRERFDQNMMPHIERGLESMLPSRRIGKMAFLSQAAAPVIQAMKVAPGQDSLVHEDQVGKESWWAQHHIRNAMRKKLGLDPFEASVDPAKQLGQINEGEFKKAKGGTVGLMRKFGQGVPTELEAMRRMSNGHRIFVVHEQDEHPKEITSVQELAGYAPDQIYTLAPQHKAKGGKITHAHHLEIEERPL